MYVLPTKQEKLPQLTDYTVNGKQIRFKSGYDTMRQIAKKSPFKRIFEIVDWIALRTSARRLNHYQREEE